MNLSLDIHNKLPVNGTTRTENWGGVFLEGTHPQVNVFNVNANQLSGVDSTGALYHFWGATTVNISNFALHGTILAPWTNVNANAISGGVETHVASLKPFLCCK
ncbi:hypothetical protein [Hyalangium versicolor]|uniref:hypothetical protein n=1 Tax=Hyalangium versicolor TaxID=2861190 RepID=UPI001CCA0B8F|nr:hypothetical protein [Hyalangium versicolor]